MNHNHAISNRLSFPLTGKLILALWAALSVLLLLAGCYKNPPPAPAPVVAPGAAAPGPVIVENPPVVVEDPNVVVADDFVYYPGYEVYYSSNRHLFYYQNGGAWVYGPTVPGFDINVVLGSPSVHMDFHDSPANHHADIVSRYPRNWRGGRP